MELGPVDGTATAASTLLVKVELPPPAQELAPVVTRRHTITSPFWASRAKALVTSWNTALHRGINRTDIPPGQGDGGIDNFVEAARALRGEPHGPHKGYVFSNAWVHQTVESICLALMVDPQGDAEIAAARRRCVDADDWIPKILAAQHPDGYLTTASRCARWRRHRATRQRRRAPWTAEWSPASPSEPRGVRSWHYSIESAIDHY